MPAGAADSILQKLWGFHLRQLEALFLLRQAEIQKDCRAAAPSTAFVSIITRLEQWLFFMDDFAEHLMTLWLGLGGLGFSGTETDRQQAEAKFENEELYYIERFFLRLVEHMAGPRSDTSSKVQVVKWIIGNVSESSVHPDKRLKMLGLLWKTEAILESTPRFWKHSAFKHFPKREVWRLFIDLSRQSFQENEFERAEPGYLAGLYRAFAASLEIRKLDAESFRFLHDLCVDRVYYRKLNKNRTVTIEAMSKGFRKGVVLFGISLRHGGSSRGIVELKRRLARQNGWCVLIENPAANPSPDVQRYSIDKRSERVLVFKKRTQRELKARVNQIFNAFYRRVTSTRQRRVKLRCIVECCQALEQAHVFTDGNARTACFIVLHKLLIDFGFSPALTNPEVFDGHAVDELIDHVETGMQQFEALKRKPKRESKT